MRYLICSLFIFLMINLAVTDAFASIGVGPDSNNTIHEHIIRNFAPFLYIAGQTQVGDLKYSFNSASEPSHTSYDVNFTSVGFEAGAGLRYKDIGLFIAGGYNFLSYYAGDHKITDTVENNGTVKVYYEPVITEHKYPRNVLLGIVGLEYRIRLTKAVQCVPFVEGKLWKFPDNRFYPKSGIDDVYYELEDNYSYGGGITLRGVLPDNSSIAMKICYLKNNFNPVGYFESLNVEDLEISHRSIEISLVYEFDFSDYSIGLFNHQFSFY